MKLFRKNQIIITTLALLIAAAGYVSYMNGSIGKKNETKLASAEEDAYEISDEDSYLEGEIFTDEEGNLDDNTAVETNGNEITTADTASIADQTTVQIDANQQQAAETESGIVNPGEAVLTQSVVNNVDYAIEMKMNREQIRSQNKETLLNLINNSNITEEQKQDAVNQMVKFTDIAEKEAAAEMLLEAKGFTDVVVSITDDTVDVILDMGEVTDAKRAQIEDIVKRKTNIQAENIIISPINVAQ